MLMGALAMASTSVVTSCTDYDDDIQANTDRITSLQSEVSSLESALSSCQSSCESKISEVSTSLSSEISAAKAELQTAINNKADASTVSALQSQVDALEESLAKRQRQVLQVVSGCSKYELENLFFYKEKDSEVRIKVTLFEKEADDPAPNVMKIRIQPIRRDGKWYLTLYDSEHDTNHGTEIHN